MPYKTVRRDFWLIYPWKNLPSPGLIGPGLHSLCITAVNGEPFFIVISERMTLFIRENKHRLNAEGSLNIRGLHVKKLCEEFSWYYNL